MVRTINFLYGYSNNIKSLSPSSVEGKFENPTSCINKIPCATLIASIMCCVGMSFFYGTSTRGMKLTASMLHAVFNISQDWYDLFHSYLAILASVMGIIILLLIVVGFLVTGSTGLEISSAWYSQIGSRISCIIFMTIVYTLQMIWFMIFCCLVIAVFLLTVSWNVCASERTWKSHCIDLQQFDFIFSSEEVLNGQLKICSKNSLSIFCNDYVKKATFVFVLALSATVLTILGLIHFLMSLSANYAYARDLKKSQELSELHHLKEWEIDTTNANKYKTMLIS